MPTPRVKQVGPRLEAQLKQVTDAYTDWEKSFERSTRDHLYGFVQKLVEFAYVLTDDREGWDELDVYYGINKDQKTYKNMWTPYIKLVMRVIVEDDVVKDVSEDGKNEGYAGELTLEPRDYRFAAVVRHFIDTGTNPAFIKKQLENGGGIKAAVDADEAKYANQQKKEDKSAQELAAAKKVPELFCVPLDDMIGLRHGWQELMVLIEDEKLYVYGSKQLGKKDDPAELEKKAIRYIGKTFAKRRTDEDGRVLPETEGEPSLRDQQCAKASTAKSVWKADSDIEFNETE